MRPTSIVVLGNRYDISYVDNPSDVDIHKREALFGQIDHWTRTIRILVKDRKESDITETLIHEILHAIEDAFKLRCFMDASGNEIEELDMLALGLTDTLTRNHMLWMDSGSGWVEESIEEEEDEDQDGVCKQLE